MDSINNFLTKYGKLTIIALLLIVLVRQCNTNSLISTSNKNILIDIKSLDSNINNQIKIESLKTSKRTLVDWNAVIRTVVRPDEQIKEYDTEINKLETKIK